MKELVDQIKAQMEAFSKSLKANGMVDMMLMLR